MNDDARTGIRPESPAPAQPSGAWGSDAIADALRALAIPYLALNPGASYRGLHDSLVNHLANRDPQMVLCLHEESARSASAMASLPHAPEGCAGAGDSGRMPVRASSFISRA